MTAGSKCRIAALALIGVSACMTSAHDPKTPNAREQRKLDAQTADVFAGMAIEDDAAWQTDRLAVEQLHMLAYWIRSYHELTGHYPLADRLDEDLDFVQCQIYGNDSTIDYGERANVRGELLLLALRERLGEELQFPADPNPDDWNGMHYDTNGLGFTVAVDLEHPVTGGEMVGADHCQYRIESTESAR